MIEYNDIIVDFKKGYIINMPKNLVQNDYNSTKLNFNFNFDGTVVFKMLYPDGEKFIVKEVKNNSIILEKGDLSQEGIYQIELSLLGEDSRLTNSAISRVEVRRELISTDQVVESDDRVPILDELVNKVNSTITSSRTNINILGSYDTIEDLKAEHLTGSVGDAYLVNGDLCVWSNNKNDWENVGKISGPQGEPGLIPTIGENGNWFLGDTDTGKPSKAKDGILFFDNVASMKSANLKAGDYAKTSGYYEVNDGGGAEYIIVDDSNLVDDGASVHDLANGLKAKMIIENNTINILSFGAIGDGTTDNYNAFTNAITYILKQTGTNKFTGINYNNNNTLKTLFIPNGNYYISHKITINDINENGMVLRGETEWNTVLKFETAGLEFTHGSSRVNFEELTFRTINSDNILVDITGGAAYETYFIQCHFYNSTKSLHIYNSAYCYLRDCSFGIPKVVNEYMVNFESGEYIYLDNVHLEGSQSTNENIGLLLNGSASQVFISNSDFCNFVGGKSIFINPGSAGITNIYIRDTSFIRNLYSIYVNNSYQLANLNITDCFLFCVNTEKTLDDGTTKKYTETFIYAYRDNGEFGTLRGCLINNLFIWGTVDTSHKYFYCQTGSGLRIEKLKSYSFIGYSNNWVNVNHQGIATKFSYKAIQTTAGTLSYLLGTYKFYNWAGEYPTLKYISIPDGYRYSDDIMKRIKVEYNDDGQLYLIFPEDPGSHWSQFNILLDYGSNITETVPTNVSSFTNDAGYITESELNDAISEKANANTTPYYFDNIATMKSANLKVGDYVKTTGYYSVNDGGGAEYIIRTKTSSDIDDGGSILVINDSLVAELIVKDDMVNIKQFGAKGDGETDDSTSFTTFLATSIQNCFIPTGTYNITNNLNFENKNITGEVDSVIATVSHPETREHQICFIGSNIIKNITFKQDTDLAICGFFNCNNSLFENCIFLANGHYVVSGGYVDLYHNNQNIKFDKCYFECYFVKDGVLQEGGIWVRESNADYVTENIFFTNCTINHTSIDECIGVWHWIGTVKNVIIDSCILTASDDSTAPHFITFSGTDCQLNNSIIRCNTNTISVIKGFDTWCQVNGCVIHANSQLKNGIANGNFIFHNCIIENEYVNSYLSVDKVSKYYNCIFNFKNIFDTRNIELYGCEVNTSGTGNYNVFVKNTVIKDCVFNINNCGVFVYGYPNFNFSFEFINSQLKVAESITKFLQIADTNTVDLNIQNSQIKGNFSNYSGTLNGVIVNNYIDGTMTTNKSNLIVKNNIYSDGTTDEA